MYYVAYNDETFHQAAEYAGFKTLQQAVAEGVREVHGGSFENCKIYDDEGWLAAEYTTEECIDYYEQELADEDKLDRALYRADRDEDR